MKAAGWDAAARHPQTPTHVTLQDVREIATEVWNELASNCSLPTDVNIHLAMDVSEKYVLAYTQRTLILVNNTWRPSFLFGYPGIDIEVHFNPDVPNGWYTGTDCRTGWRYDLRTVMRHELLHGAGLSSSIRESNGAYQVGYRPLYSDACYPTFYDTQLTENGIPVVHGCFYDAQSTNIYMAGRKIFVPDEYIAGSSFSHHDESGLFQWRLRPTQCETINAAEYDMLGGLGYDCGDAVYTQLSAGQKINPRASWGLALTIGIVLSILSRTSFSLRSAFLAAFLLSLFTHF